jgi:transcriptional regulator with XRE-family HTH domain
MTNSIDEYVGSRLRHLRERRGMTARALADTLVISAQRLEALEQGRERLTAGLIRKLSQALAAAPAEFFEGFSVTAQGVVRLTDNDAKAATEEARLMADFARIRDDDARRVILALVSSYAAFAGIAKG